MLELPVSFAGTVIYLLQKKFIYYFTNFVFYE